MASSGRVDGLPMAALPDFTVEVRRRRWCGHGEGLGHWERAKASLG
jgi:hypothetical protein